MENETKLSYGEAIEFIAIFCNDHREKLLKLSNTRAICWICILCELLPEWKPLVDFMEESPLHSQAIYDFVLGFKAIKQ